jgi:hypothetical protein
MVIQNGPASSSIEDLRAAVALSLGTSGAVLQNVIESLVIGPRPLRPVEVTLSPRWGYDWTSLYAGLSRAATDLAATLVEDDWLQRLRSARLAWLAAQPPPPLRPELGPWRARILDATAYQRPKTRTVSLGYVHSADGMKVGHGLSLLSERVGPGSWTLPLEIAWLAPQWSVVDFGATQLESFVAQHGWTEQTVLLVDAEYTNKAFLPRLKALGVPVLGRLRNNRCFYLPPPPYRGFGRPAVRGRKVKLSDQRTLPRVEAVARWELETGGHVEVSRWDDLRLHAWPQQRLVLYRVVEYKADGTARYQRPLWLVFVPVGAAVPTPRAAAALYDERFSVEHSIRFMKGELALTQGQFNGEAAEGRVQVWVEMVATALWYLWALRAEAETAATRLPPWWRSPVLTPGAVRRVALGLSVGLGWEVPAPKVRGKSPGRAAGTKLERRPRYKVYRAGAK